MSPAFFFIMKNYKQFKLSVGLIINIVCILIYIYIHYTIYSGDVLLFDYGPLNKANALEEA
jgi:hypothetical protein